MIVAVVAENSADAVRERLSELAAPWWVGHVVAEVRLDALDDPDPDAVAALIRDVGAGSVPILVTCRRVRDGGSWRGTEVERRALLERAWGSGASEVDVETDVLCDLPWARGDGVTASFHEFHGTPDDLEAIVETAFAEGAGRVKIAVRATDLPDLLRLRRVVEGASRPHRVVAFGLGPVGIPSRLLFRRMGCDRVYARWAGPAARGDEIAPGLPDLPELAGSFYPDPTLPAPVAAFGLLGDRATDSIGPRVYNRIFRRRGIAAMYLPVTAPGTSGSAGVTGLRETMRLFGLRAMSVTTPHKEAVLHQADQVHDLARRIGAANTLVLDGGRLIAHNTDYFGVREPVRDALGGVEASRGVAALVLGAGGAGRAAAVALADLGCEVTLWSRNPARATAAASEVGAQVRPGGFDGTPPRVLVNATPAGSPRLPDALPVGEDALTRGQVVLEMNYTTGATPLQTAAAARGGRVVAGAAMYAVQARHQLHHFWAGLQDVDDEVEEAVRWALAPSS